jgi:hypothetical protein
VALPSRSDAAGALTRLWSGADAQDYTIRGPKLPVVGDHDGVTKSRREKPFAEVVADVMTETTPRVRPARDLCPRDASGRRYELVDGFISPGRALELAARGAAVAWDACGCHGFCGYTWFDAGAVTEMVAWGRPRFLRKKGEWGHLSEWKSGDGSELVLAEASVRWGTHLA